VTLTPHHQTTRVTVYGGDCIDVLAQLPPNSVHAIITDPPYGLEFMGKDWDRFAPRDRTNAAVWDGRRQAQNGWQDNAASRSGKGGGGPSYRAGSTYKGATGIEDAGFEIRDTIAWLYSSGFAKGRDFPRLDYAANGDHQAATKWAGWNVALKPAHEPIVVARKPLQGTVAANVTQWGTGALNINATRVNPGTLVSGGGNGKADHGGRFGGDGGTHGARPKVESHTAGRWPANVALDGDMADALDEQSGTSGSGRGVVKTSGKRAVRDGSVYGTPNTTRHAPDDYGDSGGASRFFPTFRYTPKAPTRERPTYYAEGAGNGRVTGLGGKVRQCNVCQTRAIESGASEPSCGHGDYRWADPTTDTGNLVAHATVKPVDLFAWLIRLVVPPDGTFIDPFAGSGASGEAATLERVNAILIEKDPTSLPLITARLHTHRPRRQAPPPAPGAAHQPDLFDHLNPGDPA
jgi:hypothetical protein